VKSEHKHKELMQYASKFDKVESVVRDFINHPDKMKDKAEVNSIMNMYTSLKIKSGSPRKS
jgi:hypothetical protein